MKPDQRRTQHDLLMAFKADGVDHGPHNCEFCKLDADGPLPAGTQEETLPYTEEQMTAMAAELTSVKEELDKLRTDAAAAGVDAKIQAAVDEAVGPIKAELEESVGKVTTLTADLNARTQELEDLKAAGVKAEEDRLAAEAAAERADERVKEIREVARFTDEQASAHSAEWAALSDESWSTLLDTLRANAGGKPAAPVVRPSALTAAEVPAGDTGSGSGNSALALALAGSRAAGRSTTSEN